MMQGPQQPGMFGQPGGGMQQAPYGAPQVNGPTGAGVYGPQVQQPQTGMYPQPAPQQAPPPPQPAPPPAQTKSEEEVDARQALLLSEAKQGQTEVKLEMTKVTSKLEEISSKVGWGGGGGGGGRDRVGVAMCLSHYSIFNRLTNFKRALKLVPCQCGAPPPTWRRVCYYTTSSESCKRTSVSRRRSLSAATALSHRMSRLPSCWRGTRGEEQGGGGVGGGVEGLIKKY